MSRYPVFILKPNATTLKEGGRGDLSGQLTCAIHNQCTTRIPCTAFNVGPGYTSFIILASRTLFVTQLNIPVFRDKVRPAQSPLEEESYHELGDNSTGFPIRSSLLVLEQTKPLPEARTSDSEHRTSLT